MINWYSFLDEGVKEKALDNEMIQSAYETINDLKKEIVELKNSLAVKSNDQLQQEHGVTMHDSGLTQTNDKIDTIEQKFNAFEIMYTESQHQFIESFRNLDEKQKIYMNNIQDTIKEIVEKSLVQHDTGSKCPTAADTVDENIERNTVVQGEISKEPVDDSNAKVNEDIIQKPELIARQTEPKPLIISVDQHNSIDTSSYSEDEQTQLVCQADVHAASHIESNTFDQDDKRVTQMKKTKTKIIKDIAQNEFEMKMRQLGVDADSTGLNTPRSREIKHELVEERKGMKKVRHLNSHSDPYTITMIHFRSTNHLM